MLFQYVVAFAVWVSSQSFGATDIDAELSYATDQPLMTIRQAELRGQNRNVVSVPAGTVIHVDWDDGSDLLTTIDGQRLAISRSDLRPIHQAADNLTQQLILKPSNPELYLVRSQAYGLLGRQRNALKDFETASRLLPMWSEAAVDHRLVALNCGEATASWREAQLMQMFNPLNARGYLLNALVAINCQVDDIAEEYLWIAHELAPEDRDVRRYLALLLGQKARTEEQWQNVLGLLDELIYQNPYDYEALECRYHAHRELNDTLKAKADNAARRRLCDSWLKACPDNAEFWIRRGKLYVQLEAQTAAISDFSEAIRLDPNDFEARDYRSRLHIQSKNYHEALEDLSRMVGLQPANLVCRFQKAWALYMCQQDADAIAEIDVVLQRDPEHLEARLLRVDAAVRCQDWQTAETDVRYILGHSGAAVLPSSKLATLALMIGDDVRALAFLQHESEKSETSQNCYLMLARRNFYRGDFETAEKMLVQSGSTQPTFRIWRAVGRYLAGDFITADAELERIYVAGTTFRSVDKQRRLSVIVKKSQNKTSRLELKVDADRLRPGVPANGTFGALAARSSPAAGGLENTVESHSDELAQDARLLQNLFKIQRRELVSPGESLFKDAQSPRVRLKYDYLLVRIYGLDPQLDSRNGEAAVKRGEALLRLADTPAVLRIPLYEAIAAGYAEIGQFADAVSWQRRILDEVLRDHPCRTRYWDTHQRYLRNEKYPLGQPDPDLVTPILLSYLALEGAPALLNPLAPPLPE